MPQKTADSLEGQKFGRLEVLWRAANKVEPSGAVRTAWQCSCECGNGLVVTGHALKKGHTRSCGCLTKEKPIKHGRSRAPVYRSWAAMIQRCGNPKTRNFDAYGGRGITVCDKWKTFKGFYEDMGDPAPGMTIDRIDNERGYGPGNCRWASREEQANNCRTNVFLSYAGNTLTISQWTRVTGISKGTIKNRLKRGWSAERALTTPIPPTPLTSKET